MTEIMTQLPQNLRKLMKRNKLSESLLSRQTDIPQPVISRLLSGSTTNPRVSTLLAIAQRFKISIESIIGYQDLPSEAAISNINYLYIHTTQSLLGTEEPTEMLLSEVPSGHSAFAYVLPHDLLMPQIPQGSHIIFSRKETPRNHSLVLIKSQESILLRRLLILDTNEKHLYLPQYPEHTRALSDSDEIIGTALQVRINQLDEV